MAEDFKINIAGVMFNIPMDENECGVFEGYVKPEPTNAHDPNAIMICKKNGKKVGYVSRKKNLYISKLIEGRRWPCKIVIEAFKERDELIGIEGTCYIKNVDVSRIDMWKYEQNVNLMEDEPVINKPVDASSREYTIGKYRLYIGDRDQSLTIKGYEAALEKFQELEREIYKCRDRNTSSDVSYVNLTMEIKGAWFWQKSRIVMRKKTVTLRESDKLDIEMRCLGVIPEKTVEPFVSYGWEPMASPYSIPYSSSTDRWWEKNTWNPTKGTTQPSGASPAEKIDWDTFEKSIESDEYFDFRW